MKRPDLAMLIPVGQCPRCGSPAYPYKNMPGTSRERVRIRCSSRDYGGLCWLSTAHHARLEDAITEWKEITEAK